MFTDQLVSFEDFQQYSPSPVAVVMQKSDLNIASEPHVRFQKDSVYVHPSRDEAIQGTLSLLERKSHAGIECLLSWTPKQKAQNSDQHLREQLYALQIPLRDVGSIKRYVPTLGIPHVVVVTTSGIAFPPFYFYNGGVREFLAALKEEVTLLRSDEDPSVLLVSDSVSEAGHLLPPKRVSAELARSTLGGGSSFVAGGLGGSQLRASLAAPVMAHHVLPYSPAPAPLPPSYASLYGPVSIVSPGPPVYPSAVMPAAAYPLPAPLAASAPLSVAAPAAAGLYPTLPPLTQSAPVAPPVLPAAVPPQPLPEPSSPRPPAAAAPGASGPVTPAPDGDRPNSPYKPTGLENFAWGLLDGLSKVPKLYRMGIEAPGRLLREFDAALQSVADVPASKRSSAEPAASGVKGHLATLHPSHTTAIGAFELVDKDEEQRVPQVVRTEEISESDWCMFFDEQGRITNEGEVRRRIHYGGLTPSIRPEAWRFLLGFYPWSSTYQERDAILEERRAKYAEWKRVWKFVVSEPDAKFSKLKSRLHLIEKDVARTERSSEFYREDAAVRPDGTSNNLQMLNDILATYMFYNFDLGYVQGMNELLSPLLFEFRQEADAFWCFKGLMDVMEQNFHKDQMGMHTQLLQLSELVKYLDGGLYDYLKEHDCLNMFFCFRWILISFKREFEFAAVERVWEVLWANHLTPNLHLFLALAILMRIRQEIIEKAMEFDDILRHCNEACAAMNVEELLVEAEQIYHTFVRIVDGSAEIRRQISTPQAEQDKANSKPHPRD